MRTFQTCPLFKPHKEHVKHPRPTRILVQNSDASLPLLPKAGFSIQHVASLAQSWCESSTRPCDSNSRLSFKSLFFVMLPRKCRKRGHTGGNGYKQEAIENLTIYIRLYTYIINQKTPVPKNVCLPDQPLNGNRIVLLN
jgi:hypothetical protein